MGTYGEQIKGGLSLGGSLGPVQNKFFLTAHFFTVISAHRPATWVDTSRAGSPVSVSLAIKIFVS
jgi:hypothetical protein